MSKVWLVEQFYDGEPYEIVGVVDSAEKAEPLYRTWSEKQHLYMLGYAHLKDTYQSSVQYDIDNRMVVTMHEVQ